MRVKCTVCGELFTAPTSQYKYCSDTCKAAARKAGHAPRPDSLTLCTYCFEHVNPGEDYVWSKRKGGGTAFMHRRCWDSIPKVKSL